MGDMCERCYAPGQCCKSLHLFRGDGSEFTHWLSGGLHGALVAMNEHELPFTPLRVKQIFTDAESGDKYFTAEYNCPWLLSNGRCGTYESRPDVCRIFEPGKEPLCVHWRGAENSEMADTHG